MSLSGKCLAKDQNEIKTLHPSGSLTCWTIWEGSLKVCSEGQVVRAGLKRVNFPADIWIPTCCLSRPSFPFVVSNRTYFLMGLKIDYKRVGAT